MGLKLFACGDIFNSTGNPAWLCSDLLRLIRDADYALCNFEAPVIAEGMRGISKIGPHLWQPENSLDCLVSAGFTHVGLANNHIYDFGDSALNHTISKLEERGLVCLGAGNTFEQAYQYKIIEQNDVSIGLLAACENQFGCYYEDGLNRSGYAWLFHPCLEDNIRELAGKVDYVVLFAHAGIEDIPIPIKEWRDRYKRLCDIGVDIVIGHHPHVPQGYECISKKKMIFYSLGNFYFDTASAGDCLGEGFSVFFNFLKNTFEYAIVYHKKAGLIMSMVGSDDVSFNLNSLNSMLCIGYNELNCKLSLELYDAYYRDYYSMAIFGGRGVFSSLLNAIKGFLFKSEPRRFKGLMLLHNIRIDSHRFIVQRALSLRFET
ncbi:CapA family protein [Methylomonas koyamae]|uniref:CapA family protein n=1 Tax=Methylomonas koyamae TaxID=702114 RepID=UPI002872EB13|nr:CapA family protein [Methylomonas koyamae]WNB74218.1 CapA family protein [Methylomonas koyamae]